MNVEAMEAFMNPEDMEAFMNPEAMGAFVGILDSFVICALVHPALPLPLPLDLALPPL